MAQGTDFRASALRSIAFSSIGAGYSTIGTPIDRPARMAVFANLTDAQLMFSFDGAVDHFVLPENSSMILDITTNEVETAGLFISVGSNISVKQIGVPTTGAVYLSIFYARSV